MSSQKANETMQRVEDSRITINTRTDWSQWIASHTDVSARMIELGASEFLRYRGVRTVEVLMQHNTGTRIMVWRGLEEAPVQVIPDEIADNPAYVSRNRWPIID